MRLNLFLNIPREEFQSLTSGELLEMEEDKRQLQRRKFRADLIQEDDSNLFSIFSFGSIIHSLITTIGGYVAIAVVIFILYLIISSRLQQRAN